MNDSTLCDLFSLRLCAFARNLISRKDAKTQRERKRFPARSLNLVEIVRVMGFVVCLRLLIVLLLAIVCSSFASAQTTQTSSRIEGVVRDETGAAIEDADVSLSVASSVVAKTRTEASGRFVFNNLTAREGVLIVKARGFAVAEKIWNANETSPVLIEIILSPAPVTEQVTVTATRTETVLGETAASVVVLSSTEIAATAAATIDDALKQVTGFQLFRRSGSRTANPTSQGVSLRGVGASGASRAVVLSDGIPLNDPFGGWVYWGRVPRESVNRIEVLRGGASNLYGGGAMGGVIQILTSDADAPVFSLETSYGNENTPDASLFAGARRGRWGAKLSADLFRTDGYVLVDERERGSVDTPANSRHAAIDLDLEYYFRRVGRAFIRGSYFEESRANGTPLQTNQTRIRELSAGVDYQSKRAGAFSLRAYLGVELFDQNFSAVASNRNSETLTRVQRVPVQVEGASVQWSKLFGASHTFVAGVEAREVRGASDELAFVQGRASALVGAGGRERSFGIYGEDIFRISSRLILTSGLRLDRWSELDARSITRPLSQNLAPTIISFRDRSETAFSPQASLLYRPGENWSLAASIYRAFRAPTLNELYRTFRVGDVLTLANDQLRAERLTGGEAGASISPFKRRLTLRGTFFWTEITRPVANVTLSVAPGLITRQRQNLGRTRSRGVEIEWDAKINNRWSLSGGYTLADARVLRFPVNTSLEGLRLPQVARHQLSFQLRYMNPARLTFALQGRASGSQFDDDQNLFRLAPYFTLDAFLSRPLSHTLDAFVAVENIFDRRYEIGRTPVVTLGSPTLARAGVSLRLGAR